MINVVLVAAVTADGFIAKNTHQLSDWTSHEDKLFFRELTKRIGTMIMGSNTFDTLKRPLPGRRTIVLTRTPEKYAELGVECTSEPLQALIQRLESEGVESVAICGGSNVYGQFMKLGLINEIYLTVEPILFGQGVTLFAQALDIELALLEHRNLNDNTTLFHYKIV